MTVEIQFTLESASVFQFEPRKFSVEWPEDVPLPKVGDRIWVDYPIDATGGVSVAHLYVTQFGSHVRMTDPFYAPHGRYVTIRALLSSEDPDMPGGEMIRRQGAALEARRKGTRR